MKRAALILAVLSVLSCRAAPPAPDPANAGACHRYGLLLKHSHGADPLADALVWLERAVALAPGNAAYLADYGGTCLQIADGRRSFSFAVRGRDAMEKSLAMDPNQLDCREGLMKFFAKAPWPLGDDDRALEQAGEIGRRDRRRGAAACRTLAAIWNGTNRTADAGRAGTLAAQFAPP